MIIEDLSQEIDSDYSLKQTPKWCEGASNAKTWGKSTPNRASTSVKPWDVPNMIKEYREFQCSRGGVNREREIHHI